MKKQQKKVQKTFKALFEEIEQQQDGKDAEIWTDCIPALESLMEKSEVLQKQFIDQILTLSAKQGLQLCQLVSPR